MSIIQCTLCPNRCVMPESGVGRCKVRINLAGEIHTLTYGRPCAVHNDPIEKKPAYHFLPASRSLSIATAGCCLSCKYCQNWQISQAYPEDTPVYDLMPANVVAAAERARCKSIAYTYTEPTIFFEYMLDTARIAHTKGIANVYVTCGYINAEPLAELAPYLDVANVDLKGFTEDFYRRISGGSLEPVLNTIKYLYRQGVVVELTNLIVPTLNDDPGLIREMCQWIARDVSPDVPLHFSRFYPHYKLKNLPPTSSQTLLKAYRIAQDVGLRYVYIGNVVLEEGSNTYCPQCKKMLVERRGYAVEQIHVRNNLCDSCGYRIYGRWE